MSSAATRSQGMVVTQHDLAVRAGLDALEAGGSAADAAVAAAAVLTVVDPRSTGLGGDMFALYWPVGTTAPAGLAAAGVSPAGLTPEALRELGHRSMPVDGPWSITVPGAPAGWEHLLERFGRLGRARVVSHAIGLARDGFEVAPRVADEWTTAVTKLRRSDAAASIYLVDGDAPKPGVRLVNPDLGATLETFARAGSSDFYRGTIAERIAATVAGLGGPLRASDLAGWGGPEWVTPLSVPFRGYDVYEMPPPGQGLVVLEALAIYRGLRPSGHADEDHAAIESIKLAYDDANEHLADPSIGPVPTARLLSAEWIAEQRDRISEDDVLAANVGRASDTVYVAVVDAEGSACSLIQSLYDGFGSGVVVPGTGLALQNRASGFTLRDGHPNQVGPGKRPYHTIIPAMLGRGASFAGCLGVVGGYMQTQGQLQVLRNVFDRGMTPQQACDAPRFRVYRGREVAFEEGYPPAVVADLAARGHHVGVLDPFEGGGAQMILRDGDRFVGGSDVRKGGDVGVR